LIALKEDILRQKYMNIAIVTIFSSFLCGCTSQRYDGIGREYQLNQCQQIPDNFERNLCLDGANDNYKKQKQENKSGY